MGGCGRNLVASLDQQGQGRLLTAVYWLLYTNTIHTTVQPAFFPVLP